MKMLRSLTILILVCVSCLEAQTDSVRAVPPPTSFGIIDTIIITGNEKTKESIILREMTLKPGEEATIEAIEFDRSRVYSTGLFTSVDVSPVPFEGKNLLVVDVKERWYIIPLPLFGFRDGDPKKPYYGGGLLHNNFRGLNQKLFGSVVFGYNPSLALSFSDPWIDKEHDLYFGAGLSFSRIRNKSAIASDESGNFDELHYDINVSLGKRFTLYENLGVSLGYQIVEVTERGPGRTVEPGGIDRFIYGTIGYTYDSRDLRIYATQGNFVNLYVTKYGFGESQLSFTRMGADLRRFTPLPFDFSFASRVHGAIVSGGTIPTYARSYFGYGERIRGFFKNVFEGENMAGASVELRWPLLKPRTFHFSAIAIPQEFAFWRFGINLALFADAGTTWFRGDKVSLNSFASGYGGGVVFLLPYDIVVRTEYALNRFGKTQFIIDFRSSF
jgi:outer membrane protein assembly factor BamA